MNGLLDSQAQPEAPIVPTNNTSLMREAVEGTPFYERIDKSNMSLRNVIVGEGIGEGVQGMRAIFHVMRNQSGFFDQPIESIATSKKYAASQRPDLEQFVSNQPSNLVSAAEDIVYNPGKDMTGGALHFENIEDFGVPRYAKEEGGYIPLKKYGKHTFFVTLREYKILKKRGVLPAGLESKLIKE